MQLSDTMNFSEMGKYIMQEQADGVSRTEIEKQFRVKFDWNDGQVYSTTDPYYDEKLFVPNETKMRRK